MEEVFRIGNRIAQPIEGYYNELINKIITYAKELNIRNTSKEYFSTYKDLCIFNCIYRKKTFLGVYIIGPMKYIETVNAFDLGINLKESITPMINIRNYLDTIPMINQIQISSLENMLDVLTKSNIPIKNKYLNDITSDKNISIPNIEIQTLIKHHPYNLEKNIIHDILLEVSDNFSYTSMANYLIPTLNSKDHLRSSKTIAICMITIVCRGAIDLGVDDNISFTYSDYFIEKVEEFTRVEDVKRYMYQIIVVYQRLVKEASEKNKYTMSIKLILDYIHDHITEDLNLKDISDKFKYSYSHLSHIFKKEIGENFSSYVNRIKVKKSIELLKCSKYSILDIAVMFNYSHQYYYTKMFKKYMGMTPSEFRKKNMIRK
ncbi:helix-turn-helix domain-containing protein [Oceanirhabdus seepicola]|uniref:Helix-turn-helix transcriptional regulator n=1 Tax=Oceanirhabdus seepicola TaxID=2828781 RepID=A0A9J6NYV2_9CLOT|nr:AraC family transcriptional regulator [Oceanirhabdus seepicola]MCM1989451.1 helix-turn-helix transcriptional regulator [Oceanirhabdus seepicola]